MSTEKAKANKPPVHEIYSLDGLIRIAIWENDGERRKTYGTTLGRRYQDKDGNWHDSDTCFEDDNLVVSEMYREAWAWIWRQRRADAKARKEAARQEQQPEDAVARA